jgi:tRNA 2-thiouridine synthesizing protein A
MKSRWAPANARQPIGSPKAFDGNIQTFEEESLMVDKTLDAKGLNCPLPILKAKKSIGEVPAGGTLEVLATDPGSVADFQAFCRSTGNTLVEHSESSGVYRFLIKRAG